VDRIGFKNQYGQLNSFTQQLAPAVEYYQRTVSTGATRRILKKRKKVLPDISTNLFFDIRCHIGVIIIEDAICVDNSRSFQQKLLEGVIYEHEGNTMKRSADGTGKISTISRVRKFTALGYIGETMMENLELNSLR
jgi:hypothetical protein